MPTMTPVWRGRPTMELETKYQRQSRRRSRIEITNGKTARGASSPESERERMIWAV